MIFRKTWLLFLAAATANRKWSRSNSHATERGEDAGTTSALLHAGTTRRVHNVAAHTDQEQVVMQPRRTCTTEISIMA
jgi:hypothetical protein